MTVGQVRHVLHTFLHQLHIFIFRHPLPATNRFGQITSAYIQRNIRDMLRRATRSGPDRQLRVCNRLVIIIM